MEKEKTRRYIDLLAARLALLFFPFFFSLALF